MKESKNPLLTPYSDPSYRRQENKRRKNTQGKKPINFHSQLAYGEPMLWLTGGALVLCLLMIAGLVGLLIVQGASTFWPIPVLQIHTTNTDVYMGEVTRTDWYIPGDTEQQSPLLAAERTERRRLLRTGNFELTNTHFQWVNDPQVESETFPEWALVIERLEWGRFYGFPERFEIDGEVVASTLRKTWETFLNYHDEVRQRWHKRKELENHDLGVVNHRLEEARLDLKRAAIDFGEDSQAYRQAKNNYAEIQRWASNESESINESIQQLNEENWRYEMVLSTADGTESKITLDQIVRAYPANQLSILDKVGVYLSRWYEFLVAEPREANSEGGVFPAIFGTVVMTLLMTVAVVPFGVLAALYMREYAKAGPVVSSVRIAINNLAGVPSIVFGVFGLGFFCYIVGTTIDELFFYAKLPSPTYGTGGILWASLTLSLLTLPVVIVATEEALAAVPNSMREGSYACGASKWQTIQRIVLPRAMPGIMTGAILSMARGAGEVAPLMLVGAVKLAPELPIDGFFPYFHLERSFMHLGFHIYDLGFQSQNSEAAKPMVYTTTFLLITIIALLNITAIWLRSRLRKQFLSIHF